MCTTSKGKGRLFAAPGTPEFVRCLSPGGGNDSGFPALTPQNGVFVHFMLPLRAAGQEMDGRSAEREGIHLAARPAHFNRIKAQGSTHFNIQTAIKLHISIEFTRIKPHKAIGGEKNLRLPRGSA